MKDKTTALILSVLLGGLGVDRFYLGYTGMGLLKLLTAGCFGVLWILDIIYIATGKLLPADGSAYTDNFGASASSTPAAPVAPAAPAIDPYESLMKLAQLKEQGIITEEEFAKLKANCLSIMV